MQPFRESWPSDRDPYCRRLPCRSVLMSDPSLSPSPRPSTRTRTHPESESDAFDLRVFVSNIVLHAARTTQVSTKVTLAFHFPATPATCQRVTKRLQGSQLNGKQCYSMTWGH